MALQKKKGESRFKKLIRKLHLYIGLFTGVMVILISITGCIFVFRDELFQLSHRDLLYNNAVEGDFMKLSELRKTALDYFGEGKDIAHCVSYSDPKHNWEFHCEKHDEEAYTYFGHVVYDDILYINPHTGEIVGKLDNKWEFFHLVKMLHWNLWLEKGIGQQIVGWSVVLFVISLVSGIIIWWPKKWKALKKSIKVRWNARWRRVNYDLHRVSGFYLYPVALIIAVTGLVWAFKAVMVVVFLIGNGFSTERTPQPVVISEDVNVKKPLSQVIDEVYTDAWANFPEAHLIYINAPYPPKYDYVQTYVKNDEVVYYNGAIEKYDKYSGRKLSSLTYDQLNSGEKLYYMNYDIHVGAILGLPGKIIAFIASLICAFLPISGFMVWWGRRRKGYTHRG